MVAGSGGLREPGVLSRCFIFFSIDWRREREREGGREGERERESGREGERERERERVGGREREGGTNISGVLGKECQNSGF